MDEYYDEGEMDDQDDYRYQDGQEDEELEDDDEANHPGFIQRDEIEYDASQRITWFGSHCGTCGVRKALCREPCCGVWLGYERAQMIIYANRFKVSAFFDEGG